MSPVKHACGQWGVGGSSGPIPIRARVYADLQLDHQKVQDFDLDVHAWEDDKPARHAAFGKEWQAFKADWDKWYAGERFAHYPADVSVPSNKLSAVASWEMQLAAYIESGKKSGVQSPVEAPDLRGFVARVKTRLESALPWIGATTAALALWRALR